MTRNTANDARPTLLDGAKVSLPRPLRVCLAGSGGGHVRQLIDMEPACSAHDYFFLTEDTALSRSIAERRPTFFVPHFALGQAKLGKPLTMAINGVRSFIASAGIILRQRPQVFITTGAGAVYFALLWARLLGAKIVLIESFARFDRPSVFGRLAAPFAHRKVAQSQALAKYWPDAPVFDPMKLLDTPRPEKRPLLFATVGAILPFDRLVTMIAELKSRGEIPEEVLIQTGRGGVAPAGLRTVEALSFDEVQATLREADIVVCHGGTGSLITALRQGCRVVAVPRLFSKGEVYDDHQAEITEAFAERGLIAVANTSEELAGALRDVRSRQPQSATSDPTELVEYLRALLSDWSFRR
jgi:UDP-N-acetylglucosamine--N-acetylmuramyl-(pentapeptide) pyrophosphoryl-undecaprenol N-acetylglucosamine transferase